MLEIFLMAFALMLIIEGVFPFLSPRIWRETFKKMTTLDDGQLRFIGLTSMMLGLALFIIFS